MLETEERGAGTQSPLALNQLISHTLPTQQGRRRYSTWRDRTRLMNALTDILSNESFRELKSMVPDRAGRDSKLLLAPH